MIDDTKAVTVNNIIEANDSIMQLERAGYNRDNIFVLTHDKNRTDHIADNTDANSIGVAEEGFMTAVSNIFRSTGDELRAKMTSVGVSEGRAAQLEKEMDQGKIVILACRGREYGRDRNISDDSTYDQRPLM